MHYTGVDFARSTISGRSLRWMPRTFSVWTGIVVFAAAHTASSEVQERKPQPADGTIKVAISDSPIRPVTPLVVSFVQRKSGRNSPNTPRLADTYPTVVTIGRGQDLVGSAVTYFVQRPSVGSEKTSLAAPYGRTGTPAFRPPLTYSSLTSGYGDRIHPVLGRRRFHQGVDLAASIGTPILAASGGVVISAGWAGGYGIQVLLDHGGGYQSRYAHLSRLFVETGQVVGSGDHIGLVGATGLVTGPHLHFEIRRNGYPVNPGN